MACGKEIKGGIVGENGLCPGVSRERETLNCPMRGMRFLENDPKKNGRGRGFMRPNSHSTPQEMVLHDNKPAVEMASAMEEVSTVSLGPQVVPVTSASASVVGTKQWHTHARCRLARRSTRGSSGQRAADGSLQTAAYGKEIKG